MLQFPCFIILLKKITRKTLQTKIKMEQTGQICQKAKVSEQEEKHYEKNPTTFQIMLKYSVKIIKFKFLRLSNLYLRKTVNYLILFYAESKQAKHEPHSKPLLRESKILYQSMDIKTVTSWDVIAGSMADRYQTFAGACHFHFHKV
jgi:hypothetical protein